VEVILRKSASFFTSSWCFKGFTRLELLDILHLPLYGREMAEVAGYTMLPQRCSLLKRQKEQAVTLTQTGTDFVD